MSAAENVPSPRVSWLPQNQVLPCLMVAATLAGIDAGFLSVAPNRLVSGTPVMLWVAAGTLPAISLTAAGASLFALGFAMPRRPLHYLAAAVAGAALVAMLAAAGAAATTFASDAAAATSISLGAGFWAIFACTALALIDSLRRAEAGAFLQLLVAAIAVAGFWLMAKAGLFDALALAREYASRREAFSAAVLRHIELVVAAIVPALVIGVPLGLLALRRRRFETPLFAVLSLLQTVPSIALFGLLIAPLSGLASVFPALGALGIGGVGPAPAIVALVLYALLPVSRGTLAGIGGVPAAAIDAARGMGMGRRQIFWQVEAPLALPVLLAGFRIVLVQAIGLAVIAALIGAGGLGSFVFDGLGQYATNLVLLGALPAIALALGVDFLLRLATGSFSRRFAP
ncbi:MAG TPA: ABC transporter permease [Stellaceae bacterium]|jgi:osmoprotectant transport system permease protein|nr:ABC transporter permease [Stellaceae bacterium]